ncbi:MAG: response regulator transcription factor [Nitrospirae bacterium]|nr:response regulator transcription factor [Nitrospirota bacterium]MBF0540914.1 response regulator transcription factor [Nitrospirota bacterium]
MNNILIVDDDIDILMVLKANLEINGFRVTTVKTISEANEQLLNNSYDLMILDVTLPDGNGVKLCQDLRKDGASMPIIMLTARDTLSDRVMGLECGADDYIVKPFETIELMARMKACLRRIKSVTTENIVIGELVIDNKHRTVKVRGVEVELTPKEFDLLFYLAYHKGQVISRKEIIQKVWSSSHLYKWSRVIDVHIQHIRQKIEIDASTPRYVTTIQGIGYKIEG